MKETNNIPSYEEFKNEVIKHFSKTRGSRSDKEVNDFLKNNEDVIKADYNTNVWELENGYIDNEKFLGAGVFACSNNLYMLI